MDRATVFAPAIEYAEGGVPLTINNHQFFAGAEATLNRWPISAATYLHGGKAPLPGAILTQPNLAYTFRQIVEGGAEAFYRGPVGAKIVRFSEEHGGLLAAQGGGDDLRHHQPGAHLQALAHTYDGHVRRQHILHPHACTHGESHRNRILYDS